MKRHFGRNFPLSYPRKLQNIVPSVPPLVRASLLIYLSVAVESPATELGHFHLSPSLPRSLGLSPFPFSFAFEPTSSMAFPPCLPLHHAVQMLSVEPFVSRRIEYESRGFSSRRQLQQSFGNPFYFPRVKKVLYLLPSGLPIRDLC